MAKPAVARVDSVLSVRVPTLVAQQIESLSGGKSAAFIRAALARELSSAMFRVLRVADVPAAQLHGVGVHVEMPPAADEQAA